MTYNINSATVVVLKNGHRAEFPKLSFSTDILNDPILGELTISELVEIWDNLYGIPKNIKDILNKKIQLYRKSSGIHSFLYQGKEYWLDKEDRTSLWNLSNSSLGDLEFIVGDNIVTMSSLKLKAFLLKLEVYAYKCFVNEFKHLKAAKALVNFEDIVNYDFTTGYPDKITLE
jgi:hypothetical protein